ncbi:hypothetical protein E6W36_02860 [Hankyongella ginsenosidimutans]|uniref:histidine kinase n=1 Tax=Hankyongella ginsenosidimutans TaxID=1763828 RepID=A0A4D7C876_9SPHN|nr:Hpt domain-containing protein [Hankyongella ginsenosidimutans]QCI78923.1 hypothetical protein E6W36_02860 [Hankyongella ginsenosidimutans]
MDDLLSEFLTETNESLDTVDNELVRLEQNPNDKAVLDNIFRLVHTVKGTCGFLGLPRLESVAHAAENVLGKFRDGELVVTPQLVTLILEALDRIKEILRGLESTGHEPDGEDKDLIRVLDDAAAGNFGIASETAAADPEAEARRETELMLGRSLKPGEVSLEELEAAFAAAIDLRARLGLPPRGEGERAGMSVVVEYKGEPYSLLIDRVGEVLSLDDALFEKNPVTLDPRWREVSNGIYRLEDQLLVVLDVNRLLEQNAALAA